MRFELKRKILCWLLAATLCVTTAFTGQSIYAQGTDAQVSDETQGVAAEETADPETAEAEDAAEPETVEPEDPMLEAQDEDWITAEDLGQISEKSANSWRYDGGMMSEEAMDYNAQLGSTMEEPPVETKGAGDLGYGDTNNKSWTYKYNGKSVTSKGGYLKGIDISYWQGDINWDKVKTVVNKGGLDFVIIRCGWGTNSTSKDDSKFARNVAACESRNIPYGVYLYSYATSLSQAKSEANHTLRLLQGHYPNFPVYYDLEDKSILKATGYSKTKITGFAEKYCSMLADEGYKAGVYANLNWFTKYINGTTLKSEGCDLWLAQWVISGTKSYSSLGHGDKYSIWQCCSYGTISGISGRVDLNLLVRPHSEMENFMADRLPSKLKIKTPDKTSGYINTDSAVTKYGPGIGYRPTSVTLDYGTQVEIKGMVGKYYKLANQEDGVNVWIHKSWVAGPKDVKEIKSDVDEEENTYYYGETYDGSTITSAWFTLDGKKYHANAEGKLDTGFVKIGSYHYGFDNECAMYKSTSQWFECKKYTFDSKGRAYQKKAKMKKKASYRSGPGTKYKKKGTLKKGKYLYIIRKSGSWSQMPNGYWVKTSATKTTIIYPVCKPEVEENYQALMTETYVSRSGPGEGYLKKTPYETGTEVTVSGTYGSWAQLTSGYWVPISMLNKLEGN